MSRAFSALMPFHDLIATELAMEQQPAQQPMPQQSEQHRQDRVDRSTNLARLELANGVMADVLAMRPHLGPEWQMRFKAAARELALALEPFNQ